MKAVSYTIQGGDYEHGGAASRSVKEQLKQVGADPAVVRRAMVAAYEAEMNVVIHAHRGELRAALQNGQLDIEVIDEGPGIPDIAQAMRPGFSTASAAARELGFGAGMGLPNIQKNSDQFAIESQVGQGTSVRFSIILRPQALYGVGRRSLVIAAERCRQSFRCVHACPTHAMRVFRGKPEVLDYLCIDCTACIAACPSGALTMQGTSDTLSAAADVVLVIPRESLAQFGVGVSPQRVLQELGELGFADVRVTDAWEAALRAAVTEHAHTGATALPVISPACAAVVNLLETRFPSLLANLAPFHTAMEAVAAELGVKHGVFVVSCPCQRTALLNGGSTPKVDVVLPATLRAAVLPRLSVRSDVAQPDAARRPWPPDDPDILHVTGVRHVLNVLDAIENGLLGDVSIVEPWFCDTGCFGSPLMAEDASIARQRWEHMPVEHAASARAARRSQPFTPRKGLRLDDNMARAIQKLAKIDKLVRSLPGSDCGMCGAPTCAALAEDIVLGRAHADACVRRSADDAGAPPASREKAT